MRSPLAAILFATHAAAGPAPTPSLDGTVRIRLAAAEQPACVAVGVASDETRKAFACSAGAGPTAPDADAIFQVGSVTKGITALLLADMVVRGEVSLDDPAARYARPGAKLPRRGGREITLRDLVTHRSGLPRFPVDHSPRAPANPYADFDADALYAVLAQVELTRAVGEQHEYSNLGFMWLSEILARRAGKAFGQLLAERILRPLGMSSTGVGLPPESRSRVVMGHGPGYAAVPAWTIGEGLEGVGLLWSSLNDMLKLAEALAGRRSTPLDAAIAMALGLAWNARGDGRYDHGGGAGGYVAHVAVDRNRKTAAVVLADAATPVFDLALHLVDLGYHLRKRLEPAPLPGALDEFAGVFGPFKVWRDQGQLLAAAGTFTAELVHMGDDAFFVRAADVQFFFRRGADGRVVAVTVYIDGRRHTAGRTG